MLRHHSGVHHQPMIVAGTVVVKRAGTRDQHQTMIGCRAVHKGERHSGARIGMLPTDAKCQWIPRSVPHLDEIPRLHVAKAIEDGRAADRVEMSEKLGATAIAWPMTARVPRDLIHPMWCLDIRDVGHGNRFDFRHHRQPWNAQYLRPSRRYDKRSTHSRVGRAVPQNSCEERA